VPTNVHSVIYVKNSPDRICGVEVNNTIQYSGFVIGSDLCGFKLKKEFSETFWCNYQFSFRWISH